MKTDNTYIYLAIGIKLVKLSVPDLTQIYIIETEHENEIIDLTISTQSVITS